MRRFAGAGLTVAILFGAACGGDDSGPELSADGARGREIANERGCAACHGSNGEGAAGPGWVGLYGSTVELDDGTTVVADELYIRKSITDPDAQRRAGFTLQMPPNSLDEAEVEAVIAYIEELRVEEADVEEADGAG